MKKLMIIALCICLVVLSTACSQRVGESQSVSSGEDSSSTSLESESSGTVSENTDTAVFARGPGGQEKTMGVGDKIGDWTLTDLQIQYFEDSISILIADFAGTVTLKGTIARDPYLEYGFVFYVDQADEIKMPYYIAPEMGPKDRLIFSMRIPDDIIKTIKLDWDEKMTCRITVSDFRFIFAYTEAPSSVTVVSLELL